MVCPTIEGKIVEARDQVFIISFLPLVFNVSIFLERSELMKGPFDSERLIVLVLNVN
jgi:hypothetical protein